MNHKLRSTAAALAAAIVMSGAAAAQTVGISTLPPGAINNVQASAIAKVVQENSKLQMRLVTFNSPPAIIGAAINRQSEFAYTSADEAAFAYNGEGEYAARPMKDLRVAFTVFPFRVGAIVRNDSDIKTVADLKGKRIATEWTAFKQGIAFWDAMMATAGLSLKDASPVPTTDLLRAADDFKAGRTDAFTFAVGGPKVAEIHASIPGGVRFLSFDDSPAAQARMGAIRKEFHVARVEPRPNWPGVIGPTNLMEYYIVLMTAAHVPDQLVYDMLSAVYPNKAGLVAGHPSFNDFTPEGMAVQHDRLAYHPGAIKFYRDKGVWKGR